MEENKDILPWLDEAMSLYKERPDRIEHILMWCYCKGSANAMKALRGEDE